MSEIMIENMMKQSIYLSIYIKYNVYDFVNE